MTKREKSILDKKIDFYWNWFQTREELYGEKSPEAAEARAMWLTLECLKGELEEVTQ